MTIDVNYVLERLSTQQIESGGYYGTDITKLSKELGVTPRGLRKQISTWKRSIKEFHNLKYLGQRPPSVTLEEFIEIEARMFSNPIEVKSHVLEDITADRLSKGLQDLPSSTFYRARKQTDLYQFLSEAKYSWFKVRGIEIPNDYSVYDERNTLSTLFTFSDLKAYGGADLQDIFNRLISAKRHIEKYGINAFEFYPQILNRGSNLRSLLSSIPLRQQEETQARLIFEAQLAYVVECTDLFVNEIIHRKARFKLLRANKNTYEFLSGLLQEFTKDGLNEFHFHLDERKRFFDLACGETNWKYWSDKDKRVRREVVRGNRVPRWKFQIQKR
jgi:hypothetical protein